MISFLSASMSASLFASELMGAMATLVLSGSDAELDSEGVQDSSLESPSIIIFILKIYTIYFIIILS